MNRWTYGTNIWWNNWPWQHLGWVQRSIVPSNFGSVRPSVHPWECWLTDWHAHTHTHTQTGPHLAGTRQDILVILICGHFLKYRLSISVKVRTDKITAIGYCLWSNIGTKYQLYFGGLVKLRTDKISVMALVRYRYSVITICHPWIYPTEFK